MGRALDRVARRIASALELERAAPRISVDLGLVRRWLEYYVAYQDTAVHPNGRPRTSKSFVAGPFLVVVRLDLERRLAFVLWAKGDADVALRELDRLR